MSFDLSDYVDVPTRVRLFFDKYPNGSLQTEAVYVNDGWLCTGFAYRTPDDPKPGIGHSYMQVPGTTSYTRDSELENAETSAWGRAIVACGFPSKKIASTEEVLARQPHERRADESTGSFKDSGVVAAAPEHPVAKAQAAAEAAKEARTPHDNGHPAEVVITFGKHKDSKIADVPQSYIEWLAGDKFDPKTADQRRIKTAAYAYLYDAVPAGALSAYDDDIPF